MERHKARLLREEIRVGGCLLPFLSAVRDLSTVTRKTAILPVVLRGYEIRDLSQ